MKNIKKNKNLFVENKMNLSKNKENIKIEFIKKKKNKFTNKKKKPINKKKILKILFKQIQQIKILMKK